MNDRTNRWPRMIMGAAALGVAVACATNPVTGKRELSLVSEGQEIEMGREAAEQVKQSIGVTPDNALQQYVAGLGMPIARGSERPNLPWQFTVVEDPSVNAFALPGGPVFVTRGILAHMNSEAQLVSVLGHEIGHITAKHSVNQISKSQLTQLAVIGAVVVKPELAQFGDLAMSGLGLLFMKFSRDDETQADDLGFRYMTKQSYDPHEMAEMFKTLDRLSSGAEGKTPQWLSTHPDPGNRVAATNQRIAAAGATLGTNLRVNRDGFLQRLEGMIFGMNPREGFFRGSTFLHPDMRIQFDFPSGWKTQNSASQVAGISGGQDAIVALTLVAGKTPQQAMNEFLAQQGMQSRTGAQNASYGGFQSTSSAFTLTQENGALAGWVVFMNIDGTTMRLVGYTTSDKIGTYDNVLHQSVTSMRRLTDPTALNVQPNRVRLVRINRGMTIAQFNSQYPSKITLAELALINGVDQNAVIPSGTLVKRVDQ